MRKHKIYNFLEQYISIIINMANFFFFFHKVLGLNCNYKSPQVRQQSRLTGTENLSYIH